MNDAAARNLPAERKPQLVAGAPVAALVPQTLEEAFRLSGALAASGMAPKGIDRPEQIMVAIMAGAELGLAPFQSLQSFAIVNGRPTLYGDGLMAVARQHGVHIKEWLEGQGDAMVAHCEVTRPDGEVITRTFTIAQARKAGLWGKAGPWTQYPERMLQMRARAWALRDGCADMLRGIQVREEVEDFSHVRDITPKPSGLAARLNGPSGEGFTSANAEPVEFAEQAEEIAEAEFVAEVVQDECDHDWQTDANVHQCRKCGVIDDAGEAEPPKSVTDRLPAETADDFDAMDWAGSFTRGLASLMTVTEVSSAWSRAKADGHVAKLRARSEDAAKRLADTVNSRVAEIKAAGE